MTGLVSSADSDIFEDVPDVISGAVIRDLFARLSAVPGQVAM